MIKTQAALAIITAISSASVGATERSIPNNAAEAIASLEGEWKGALEYRDYQSNELARIPLEVTFQSIEDDVSFIQRSAFTDPAFRVFITSLMQFDEATGEVDIANARAGRDFETYSQHVTLLENNSGDDWSLRFTRIGLDDNRPAVIRETMEIEGVRLTVTKHVDFLDDDGSEWAFRNRLNLVRE